MQPRLGDTITPLLTLEHSKVELEQLAQDVIASNNFELVDGYFSANASMGVLLSLFIRKVRE